MSYSLNEIEAQAKRAARGAGLSWGMAEEAGRATRWLAAYDLPGPELLCQVLRLNDGVPQKQIAPRLGGDAWYSVSGALCPLAAGAALNDIADQIGAGQPIEMAHVSFPLLVVPFAAWAAQHLKRPVRVIWQDVRIDTDGDGIWIDGTGMNASEAGTLQCHLARVRHDPAQRPLIRGSVTPEVWADLDVFAHRTYAPATEASRLLGAGSGVSDND
jgi:hypothetical protein